VLSVWHLDFVWVPDAAHEARRDLVRAPAAAKQDEYRAKHRLIKYLLRAGWCNPESRRAWTHPWWRWLQSLKLDHAPQQTTPLSHVAEVPHQGERVSRFDKDIELTVESASPKKKVVIEALQALRGVAKLTAITIVTEIGTFQRFRKPTELMRYTRFSQTKPRPRVSCDRKNYDLMLYGVTSTYFEGQAKLNEMAKCGYSRDHGSDYEQV
jgi:transposase